jgi:environmental stress-induced protein Ves
MRILRAADYRVMPWKNGGGTTTEIAVSPEGAGLDDFDWRISMARVERDGPFSTFTGVDRTLSILDGEGIFLNVSGRIPIGLTKASEPLSFPADTVTGARLIGGPIGDLNVMTRRARMRHSVERLIVSGDIEFASETDAMAVFCLEGPLMVGENEINRLDTLWLDAGHSSIRLTAPVQATVFVIGFHAIAERI